MNPFESKEFANDALDEWQREALGAAQKRRARRDRRGSEQLLTRGSNGVPLVLQRADEVLPLSRASKTLGARASQSRSSLASYGIQALEPEHPRKFCWIMPHKLATRQCFTCAQYDPAGTGFYCEAAFIKAHPWHRAPHNWVYIVQKPLPLPLPKLTKKQATATAAFDLLSTLQRQRQLLQVPSAVQYSEREHAAAKCDELLMRSLAGLEVVRDDIKRRQNISAIIIQSMYRTRAAWNRFKARFKYVWNYVHEEDGLYYADRVTGLTRWVRPLCAGREVTINPFPPILWTDIEPETAAHMIQCAWRTHEAFGIAHKLCKQRIRVLKDAATGQKYYFDQVTGLSSWNRPLFLGTKKPSKKRTKSGKKTRRLTERQKVSTRRRSVRSSRKRRVRLGRRAQDLTPGQAASKITAWLRACYEREFMVWPRAQRVYEKVYDPDSDSYFYYNRRLDTSMWEKPVLFGNRDVPIGRTERTARTGRTVRGGPRTGRRAQDLTVDQAALKITSFFRLVQAKMRVLRMVAVTWEQVWDDEYGAFYYYNKQTDEAVWDKPLVLAQLNLALLREDDVEEAEGLQTARPSQARPSRRASKLTELSAAVKLQTFARVVLARIQLKQLASITFDKVRDEQYGEAYYFNTVTGESQWTKPSIFWAWDLPDGHTAEAAYLAMLLRPRPGHRAQDLTDTQAATKIQSLYRMRRDWLRVVVMGQLQYQEVWDEENEAYYYFHGPSEYSTWVKPAFFGTQPVGLPAGDNAAEGAAHAAENVSETSTHSVRAPSRTHTARPAELASTRLAERQAVQARPRTAPGGPAGASAARITADLMTPAYAATRIQSAWRAKCGRARARARARSVYSMHEDPASGITFYFNALTGESTWEPPAFLHRIFKSDHMLLPTARAGQAERATAPPSRPGSSKPGQATARSWLAPYSEGMTNLPSSRLSCLQAMRTGSQTSRSGITEQFLKPKRPSSRPPSSPSALSRARRVVAAAAGEPAAESSFAMELRPESLRSSPQLSRPASASTTWSDMTSRSAAPPMSERAGRMGSLIDEDAVQLPYRRMEVIHKRQLRMFALHTEKRLAANVDEMWAQHGPAVWEVLVQYYPEAQQYREAAKLSEGRALDLLKQAVRERSNESIGRNLRPNEIETDPNKYNPFLEHEHAAKAQGKRLLKLTAVHMNRPAGRPGFSIAADVRESPRQTGAGSQAGMVEAAMAAVPAGVVAGRRAGAAPRTGQLKSAVPKARQDEMMSAAREFFAKMSARSAEARSARSGGSVHGSARFGQAAAAPADTQRSAGASTPRPDERKARAGRTHSHRQI